MAEAFADQTVLSALAPGFREEIEAGVVALLARIAPATIDRIEDLAAIAAAEAASARFARRAETAAALAAELRRRARLMRN